MTVVMTLDIDWAPDWMIREVADLLRVHRVKATWFVTHASAAVAELAGDPALFELGIHPNCLPGSTHGATEEDVLRHVRSLVPEAISMRTHGLYQSSRFLVKAAAAGIRTDVSLFLPRAARLPVHAFRLDGHEIRRVPYAWEDDYEMAQPDAVWEVDAEGLVAGDLNVFAFHPVHIVLNGATCEPYRSLKMLPPDQWTRERVSGLRRDGKGPGSLFLGLLRQASHASALVREVA